MDRANAYETVILSVGGIIQRTIMGSTPHETTVALPLKVNLYRSITSSLKQYKLMLPHSQWSGHWFQQIKTIMKY